MIEQDLIESLPDEQQRIVKNAMISILGSGIIDDQLERMAMRLREGDFDQDVDMLAQEILEFRWKAAGLRSFRKLAESILQGERR